MSVETEGFGQEQENEPKSVEGEYQELSGLEAELDQALEEQNTQKAEELLLELEQRTSALEERVALPIERELKLKEQYQSQVELLAEHHLIQELSNGKRGIVGIDGKEYPLPSYQEIRAGLKESRELLEKKAEQGFAKLLLVPFGLAVSELKAAHQAELLRRHENDTLLSSDGTPLVKLDSSGSKQSLADYYVFEENADTNQDPNQAVCYYGVRKFPEKDQSGNYEQFNPQVHGGQTKQEILGEGGAWQVFLVEDTGVLPAENEGETKGGRKQMETNQTPRDYLSLTQEEEPYQGETGLTRESWIILSLSHLKETNRQIDIYDSNDLSQGKICYLFDSFIVSPSGGYVSRADFDRGFRQAYLTGDGPGVAFSSIAARPAVKIAKKLKL